ncbi:hypothetical protein M569_16789 [Genlisea aurea]|uniref:N-acetyltransferase domain-containing protein n=1 Tax=Genlisea aurea TaxID=192259 RepID=S8C0Q9_9LAMI|nr:hypothetical protein M569_16789 [Genlisea aurea]
MVVVVDGGVVAVVVVREYDDEKDSVAVGKAESRWESSGPCGKLSLQTDHLGDPICRVRHSPSRLMLVAEMVVVGGGEKEEKREIVGMIRGCVKNVSSGASGSLVRVAYVLGLRVSPSHRRMGIGLNLVRRMEKWFVENGAEFSYMATEKDNKPSMDLFTRRCGYEEFRTPALLVQPVFAHRLRIDRRVAVIELSPADAEVLYRRRFSGVEFFPMDIDAVLNNRLNLGTFLAVPRGSYAAGTWPGAGEFLRRPAESWAVVSVWNCKDVFRLRVRGASRVRKALARTTRVVDRAFPCLRIPSVPEFFRPFGAHFLYGLGGCGPNAAKLTKALCCVAHNLAMDSGCQVIATEIAAGDPLRAGIPHWKRLSCAEDQWCIKRLTQEESAAAAAAAVSWTGGPPSSIFVDPREI